MTRAKAMEIVKTGGGNPQEGVTNNTDYVVVGIHDLSKFNGHTASSKMRKALDMQAKGHKVKIIDEGEFLKMIDDELYQICFHEELQGHARNHPALRRPACLHE